MNSVGLSRENWEIEFICQDESAAGSPFSRKLKLTLSDQDDENVLATKGAKALRRKRMMRLSQEARDQGFPLTCDELSTLLFTPRSILEKDIAYLESLGETVPLRRRAHLPVAAQGALAGCGRLGALFPRFRLKALKDHTEPASEELT